MILETLDNAKFHLHETDPAHDAQVTHYLELASGLIFDYIGERADPSWDETTAPAVVQAATLKMLGSIWEHRGDDAESSTKYDEHTWEAVKLMLMRVRDPVIA